MESVAILSHSFINKKGSIIPCRTAIVDLGTKQIDPGLTPDGAKCGEGKVLFFLFLNLLYLYNENKIGVPCRCVLTKGAEMS